MWAAQRILAVVPARGGSKGIPLKNLRPVGGLSLVAHAARVVRTLSWIDRAVVSTDHDSIAAEAEAHGLAAPFRRPESLSGDRIGDLEVLVHALESCETMDNQRYDIVLMLQPTCPLRRPAHVEACVRELVEHSLDSVWTVSETDSKHHPLKQLTLTQGRLEYYDPAGAAVIARQQLTPVYHRNGAAYACSRACLLQQRRLLGARASAVVIEDPLANIDTPDDLEAAERLLASLPRN